MISSNYLSDEADAAIREVLRNVRMRHVKGKGLPKFYVTSEEAEKAMFKVIDNAISELCDECPGNTDGDEDKGRPVPWEELD